MTTRLESVSTTGLKTKDINVTLTPAMFRYGLNGKGKTEMVNGIHLALAGYVHGLGKRNDDVMRLARGDDLVVDGKWSTPTGEFRIIRSWERRIATKGVNEGTPTVSAHLAVTNQQGKRLSGKGAKQSIIDNIGTADILDLSEFLGMSDAKRRGMLFRLGAEKSGWTVAKIQKSLSQIGDDIPGNPKPATGQTPPEWLGEVYEACREHSKTWRARKDALEKEVEGLEEDVAPIEPADVGNARTAHKAAQEAARTASADQARAVADATQRLNDARADDQLRRQLFHDLTQTRTEIDHAQVEGADGDSAEVANAKARLEELNSAFLGIQDDRDDLAKAKVGLAEAKESEAFCLKDAEAAYAALSAAGTEQSDAENATRRLRDEVDGKVNQRVDVAAKAEQAADAAKTVARESLNQIGRLISSGDDAHCPLCEQMVGPDMKPAFQARYNAAFAAHEVESKALNKEKADARAWAAEQLADAVEREKVATKAQVAAHQAERTAKGEHAAKSRATQDQQQRVDNLDNDVREKETEIRQLEQVIAEADSTDNSARIARLNERKTNIDIQIEQIAEVDLADFSKALEMARTTQAKVNLAAGEEADRLSEQLQDKERLLGVLQHKQQTRVEMEEARATYERAQTIEHDIGPKGLMGQVVADVLRPFEEAVSPLIPANLGIFKVVTTDDRGNPRCRPGLVTPGDQFVELATLSGGESLAAKLACLKGLAFLNSSPWCPIIGDELERLDSKARSSFLQECVALVDAGVVDQLIASGCPDNRPEIAGLAVEEV